MPESLAVLEERRLQLYQQLVAIGDFRPGMISVNYRKCGRGNCRCAQPDHGGHGPQYLWNTTQQGKSRAQNLRLGPELEKVEQEVANYRRFVELCGELVQVNEQICRTRPVPEVADERELARLKKNFAAEVQQEVRQEIERMVGRLVRAESSFDLEASEMAIRASMQAVGGVVLEKLLNSDGGGYEGARVACGAGHAASFIDYRSKEVTTVLAPVAVKRAYYHCAACAAGVIPKDQELDVVGTSFSPGVRRLMGRVGGKESFNEGRRDLEELAGIRVKTKEVERIAEGIGVQLEGLGQREREQAVAAKVVALKSVAKLYVSFDGTGVPVIKRETAGRRGKSESGEAQTREAKLGCVFTQTGVDEKGRPVRDEASTTYVGAIEVAETFGWRIYGEAERRGARRAAQVIIIGDGALWVWGIAEEHFPNATQIVDLYHAREHLIDLSKIVYGVGHSKAKQWSAERITQLDAGEVEAVLSSMRRLRPTAENMKEELRKTVNYFESNIERMRYAEFHRQGLFVGSGVIEAGCKTIVGQRLKQSGMRWSLRGANAIIALRCAQLSGRWEEFWEMRAAG